MSKRWRWTLLLWILAAVLLLVFAWMRLPQNIQKAIGVEEDCLLYVYTGDIEGDGENHGSPPEERELELLPTVLAQSSFRAMGFRRIVRAEPGESVYYFTIHAFSPEGEWRGEIPVALRGGDILYRPFGEKGYLWYSIDCDARTAVQELRRLRGIN